MTTKAEEARRAARAQAAREMRERQCAAILGLLEDLPGATAVMLSAAISFSQPGEQQLDLDLGDSLPPGVTLLDITLGRLIELECSHRVRKEDDPAGARYYLITKKTARTGDTTMTVSKTPAQKARTRYLTAAKRSLGLIADMAAQHLVALEAGELPGGTFAASVRKYEEALTALTVLAEVGAPAEPASDNGLVEVHRDDLEPFILLVRQAFPEATAGSGPDTPLGRLEAAIPPFTMPAAAAEAGPDGGSA